MEGGCPSTGEGRGGEGEGERGGREVGENNTENEMKNV